ncbi:MAG: J domain-containing protein [Phycisphaerae bacterium]|nr:J domain-containing protein [Phycisphaerae bacterium]NUQ46561.1 J domain-containing protein [Phycisphaerae bacterium]
MNPLFLLGIGAGFGLLRKYLSNQDAPPAPVGYKRSGRFDVPAERISYYFHHFLTSLKFEQAETESDGVVIYFRGDSSITELPWSRDVANSEIPMYVGGCLIEEDGETALTVHVKVPDTVACTPAAAAHVNAHIRDMIDRFFSVLRRYADDCRDAREEAEREDRERCGAGKVEDEQLLDLAALGLAPGASWPAVHGAYRDACNKYHPDRFSGQDVASHLVDLAASRFKEISDAYRRLKDRMEPACSQSSV